MSFAAMKTAMFLYITAKTFALAVLVEANPEFYDRLKGEDVYAGKKMRAGIMQC